MSQRAPLVSIIIPCFNYARYLGAAIETARAQTHRNVEVIVVDDGSSDDSRQVAQKYPVKLLVQENAGVARARNHGAAEARGELFVFLDADDELEPVYVERCLCALEGAGARAAYAYTQMRYFGDRDGVHESGPFSRKRILRGNLVNASALVKRSAFEHAGGFSKAWRVGWEDCELWVRMYSLGYEGVFVPEPLIRYRQHGKSRNALSRSELRALDWRLWWSYPKLYWPRLLRHPFKLAQSLVRPPDR
ncbi:MAG: glycosyltransferase family 2 protein [Deltaproteobacteria bacterium]|nr:glycosyltransferase family 2 protein [Deltaproteobacteria bacterium]